MSGEPLLKDHVAGVRTDGDPLSPPTEGASSTRPKNSHVPFLLCYLVPGFLILVNYVVVGAYLNEKYPEGNSVNPKQTGAFNLWGSIYDPDHRALYCLYGVGFLVAITGFLLHLSFVMRCFLEIEPSLYCKICVAMLCFMATEHCWMPLCCVYIAAPSDVLWWVICLQLKLSGLLTLVWTYFTWQIDPEILAEASYGGPVGDAGKRKLYRKIGLCGNVMFCLHCCVLDGTVWSFYFNADGGRFPPPTAGG